MNNDITDKYEVLTSKHNELQDTFRKVNEVNHKQKESIVELESKYHQLMEENKNLSEVAKRFEEERNGINEMLKDCYKKHALETKEISHGTSLNDALLREKSKSGKLQEELLSLQKQMERESKNETAKLYDEKMNLLRQIQSLKDDNENLRKQ